MTSYCGLVDAKIRASDKDLPVQVVESEKTAKWQYTQHCEELTEEIKKLRTEVSGLST